MENLPRSARATRGKRLSKLLDDEADADNTFWGQEAFKEERNDNEYEEEEEQVDEFDSDFDDEEAPESEGEKEVKEVVKKKRKLPYKKPTSDKKKKSVSFLLKTGARTEPKPKKASPKEQDDGDAEGERVVRKSTRVSVVARQAERAAKAAASQTTPKPVKRKKEEKRLTQEDMLLEAAQTEVINLQSLERMLAREEEVKKRAIIQKSVYNGPQVRLISKNGINILEFTKVSTFPSAINSKAKPYPERAVCVVTGLPAKYKDPKTGQPYATKEAFKLLRERFASSSTRRDSLEEIHQRKRTKVEAERAASSRAGVVKLKFKKSPGGNSNAAATSSSPHQHQQHQQQQQRNHQAGPSASVAPPPPPPPDEADFMLEGLDDLKPDYKIEDSILYETSEKLEAQFASEFPWQR